MRDHTKLLRSGFIILSLLLSSCNSPSPKAGETKEIEGNDTADADVPPHTSEKQIPEPDYRYYRVGAREGVHFRRSPDGEILGQWPLNKRIKVIQNISFPGQITKEHESIKGAWVGVELNNDTVFVFDAFLTSNFTYSETKIFYAGPGFVNLSEGFIQNSAADSIPVIPREDIGKDPIWLGDKSKEILLQSTGISNRDSLFLFSLHEDSIVKYPVAELKAMARLSMYAHIDDPRLSDYNYEVGFSLGKDYMLKGETFAYVGSANPFQVGKVKSMLWEEVDTLQLSKALNQDFIPDSIRLKFKEAEDLIFSFHFGHWSYYIITKSRHLPVAYHLIVIDSTTNTMVFNDTFIDSESKRPLPLATAETKDEHYSRQWTGAIFKEKPPIVYGFMGHSFGCPKIQFLRNELPIRILCDNRH